MPNTREKLIEVLETVVDPVVVSAYGEVHVSTARVADHLIANGVRLEEKQATSDATSEWIPVAERLPKDNERVLAYHDDGVIRFGINKDGFADVVSTLYLKHNHRTCFSKAPIGCPCRSHRKENDRWMRN